MRDRTILLVHVVTHQLRILSRSRRRAIDQGTYGRYLVVNSCTGGTTSIYGFAVIRQLTDSVISESCTFPY
jgi:hypothetical protein